MNSLADSHADTAPYARTTYHYNAATHELSSKHQAARWTLSKQAGTLLGLFLRAPKYTLSRDEIRFQLWGHAVVSDDVINHAICRLRKQLTSIDTPDPLQIETLPGIGYRLCGVEDAPHAQRPYRHWVILASLLSLL
ncbi:winged helix-turn-helix domain-containing protein [Alteromonas sp. ASW11-19]|uniref:Winged helix-turn-helix domain-containing protein n=1 Tax=Alteromonas salexigens TaxID=2982530 RepID=A0ABT2VKS0_9ALTE|nr:winged helix-turn-helix domain-containing protein [Alteromonas salexigens]MCU7553896.1 winged helix-turn-helix domain-containing protein [Alteromonas salexigens]